jgi:hypothetical protein
MTFEKLPDDRNHCANHNAQDTWALCASPTFITCHCRPLCPTTEHTHTCVCAPLQNALLFASFGLPSFTSLCFFSLPLSLFLPFVFVCGSTYPRAYKLTARGLSGVVPFVLHATPIKQLTRVCCCVDSIAVVVVIYRGNEPAKSCGYKYFPAHPLLFLVPLLHGGFCRTKTSNVPEGRH